MWTESSVCSILGLSKAVHNREVYADGWNHMEGHYRVIDDPIVSNMKCYIIEDDMYNKMKNWGTGKLSQKFFDYRTKKARIFSESTFREFIRQHPSFDRRTRRERQMDYSWGIYGIYQNGELVYIGKTRRPFEVRWQEHCDILNGKIEKPKGMVLYDNLNARKDKIEFGILLDCAKIKVAGQITERDLSVMELTMISYFQPKYNWVGVRKEYQL